MTVTKLIKILQQAKKNGQGEQEIMVEQMGKDNFPHEYTFDMYHCERETDNHHYNVCAQIPFSSKEWLN